MMKMAALACVAMFSFAACSDSDDDSKPEAENAQMLTFGFYQEDNAGVLSKDYVATVPQLATGTTRYDISIAMPAVVDKSALVARFTINDKNTIVVGSTAQVSKETRNNFTAPVDYTVSNSDKTKNVVYTVTVTKADNMTWSEAATFATAVAGGAVLKVSAKDGLPYVAVKEKESGKMTVAKYNAEWATVGEAAFTGAVNGTHFDFDLDKEGTPYVAFGDGSATTLKNSLSVMKFDGSAWSYVGGQDITDVVVNYVGLATASSDLVVSFRGNSKTGSIPRQAMGLAVYHDNAWSVGESSLLSTGQRMWMMKAAGNGNSANVISINANTVDNVNYGYNIFKYENGQWTSLLTNFLEAGATQTSIAAGSFGTTIAPDGTIYAWTGDDAPNTDNVYQVRLKKYDATANTWQTVGGNTLPIGHDGGFESHISLDVAIAPDGTPFVAYNNFKDQKKLYVMYLDPETRQWTTPVQLAEGASDVNIGFASTGEGYITYTDEANQIHLFKYAER